MEKSGSEQKPIEQLNLFLSSFPKKKVKDSKLENQEKKFGPVVMKTSMSKKTSGVCIHAGTLRDQCMHSVMEVSGLPA